MSVQSLSTRDYLDRIESTYRRRLAGVSLAAEVPFTETKLGDTVKALGRLYRSQGPAGERTREWRSRPAAVVLGLTAFAAAAYRGSGWWPELAEKAGISNWSNTDAEAWGAAFRSACRSLDLPVIEANGRHHVGPIVVHTGVPDYCVEALLAEVIRVRDHLGTSDGARIATHIAAHPRPGDLHQPAYDFVRFGDIYAHDVIERLLDAVELFHRGQDVGMAQLPARIEAKVVEALSARGAQRSRASSTFQAATTSTASEASVHLEPWGDGLVLLVPSDDQHSWRITMDRASDVLPPTSSVTAAGRRPRRCPLMEPVRMVTAARVGGRARPIRLYEDDAPLIAFTSDGTFLAPGRALPAGDVWLVHPSDNPLDLAPERVREEVDLPLGWAGWSLVLADLDGAVTVASRGGRSRPVLRRGGPKIGWPQPLPTVTDAGAPVYATRPVVTFTGDDLELWRVGVQHVGAPQTARYQDAAPSVDPWAGQTTPVVGRFEIIARGPLGRGFRYPVTVAEGLAVRSEPALREMNERGLTQAEVTITTPSGVPRSADRIRLDERTPDADVLIGGPTSRLLTVTPQHRWVSWTGTTEHRDRQYTPMTLALEDITSTDAGVLEVGGATAEDIRLFLTTGRDEQVVNPEKSRRPGRSRFDLRTIVDTVRAHGAGDLCVLTPSGRQLVARLRPKKLFQSVVVRDGILTFHGFCARDDVQAAFWTAKAPWRPPVTAAVPTSGVLALPEPLHDAGALLLSVVIDDPWVPWSPPAWPPAKTWTLLHQQGEPRPDDEPERRLLEFLAGDSHDPGPDLDRVWILADRTLNSITARPDLADAVGRVLRRNPLAALRTLARSDVESRHVPEILIRTGLAAVCVEGADEALADELWTVHPSAAGLTLPTMLLSPHLSRRADTPPGDDTDDDTSTPAGIREVPLAACGDTITVLLEGGTDPYQRSGAFDSFVDYFETLPTQKKRAMIRAAGIVPKALLDGDRRTLNALALFEARDRLDPLARVAATLVRDCLTVLNVNGCQRAVSGIDARRHPTIREDWREMAALSLALAATARLAARGNRAAASVEAGARPYWAPLAHAVPDLVATDLVLGDLLVHDATTRGTVQGGGAA